MSNSELENLTRKYTTATMNIIGPNQDIASPDLGTSAQTMAWVMDTYSMGIGRTSPGVVTGKPVEIGGTLGRDKSVGWGLASILRDFTLRESEEIRNQKIIITGIGHVGRNAADTAARYGAKIIGISDSSAGIFNENGLDINNVLQYKDENKSLKGYERAQEMDNTELLTQKCDAIIPCATSNQITKEIAEKLDCRAIIEGANHPTTFEADQIIDQRDITLIPDIIANAGGLIVSYFEWVQDISALQWATDRIQKELDRIILNAFENVIRMKHEQGVSYKRAAHMIAVQHITQAMKLRGVYP